ncbi:hypothetical protein SHKM778_71230 [Streptomyces sp. KM77-8]|uniref:Uncharacterized protein n=1 Tax=Streptomyces haneummycinicus TaxID=3074435 RepID=A0AAT9HT91_9ACTN
MHRLRDHRRRFLLRRDAAEGAEGRAALGLTGRGGFLALGGGGSEDVVPLGGRLAAVEAGRDHGDPDLVAEGVVDHRAEDDVGLGVGGLADQLGRLVDLEQAEVGAAGDGEQDATGAVDGRFEERGGDGHLGGGHRAVVAAGRADAHEGGTGLRHDRLDVGEVEVDEAGRGDEVGDALDTGEQHLVRRLEGVENRHLAVRDGQQPVVRDHDEGVDLFAEFGDAVLGLVRAAPSLEGERAGDHTDGEGAERAGDVGHDGRATGTGAAALTGRHEDHVGPLEDLLDLLAVVLRGLAADGRVGSGAESAGEFTADVELDVGVAHQQGLRVGVDGDELDALETDLDHPVDGIDTTAADTDDFDDCEVVLRCCHVEGLSPRVTCRPTAEALLPRDPTTDAEWDGP